MILVDADKHTGGNGVSQNSNINVEPLTQAIKSLANKSQFGPKTITVTHLSSELDQILKREDLDPSTKLKLYNNELQRFLFFHRKPRRVSNNNAVERLPERTDNDVEMDSVADDDANEYEDIDDIDMASLVDSEYGAVGGYPRPPVAFSTPPRQVSNRSIISPLNADFSTPKKRPSTSPGPPPKRFKSNLPRTTPKHKILRQNRKLKREGNFDYFLDWVSKRRKQT